MIVIEINKQLMYLQLIFKKQICIKQSLSPTASL